VHGRGKGQLQPAAVVQHGDPSDMIEVAVGEDDVADGVAGEPQPGQAGQKIPFGTHPENPLLFGCQLVANPGLNEHVPLAHLHQHGRICQPHVAVRGGGALFLPEHPGDHAEHGAAVDLEHPALQPMDGKRTKSESLRHLFVLQIFHATIPS
jgi:hypothetical protein